MQPATLPFEVSAEELEGLLECVREGLGESGYQKLKAAIRPLGYLTELLRERKITLEGLRELLLSGAKPSTEKTRHVLKQAGIETQKKNPREARTCRRLGSRRGPDMAAMESTLMAERRRSKFRIPAYTPAIDAPVVARERSMFWRRRVLVRLVGQAPITGTVYELEKLRCNLCLAVFTAEAPAGVGEEKNNATSASMMALLKYGSGMPSYRLEGLQEKLEIPLPASTQWGIVKETAEQLEPALEELIRQAAQGEVVYNDDTGMKVLALPAPDRPERTGVFTSGIISPAKDNGWRCSSPADGTLGKICPRCWLVGLPIWLLPCKCNALSRNLPKTLEVILGVCAWSTPVREGGAEFSGQCQFVLETTG